MFVEQWGEQPDSDIWHCGDDNGEGNIVVILTQAPGATVCVPSATLDVAVRSLKGKKVSTQAPKIQIHST